MRNPQRIEEVLAAIRAAWQSDPDLRLGQLIVNAVRPTSPCLEVFFIEDEKLEEGIKAYMKMKSEPRI